MRRRKFVGGLIGAASLWSFPARAQQSVPVIGLLAAPSKAYYLANLNALRRGLKEVGFIEGKNVTFEYRWADGQYERLPAMAADLVARHVAVIATMGGVPAAVAAKAATSTVPIVFSVADDPVKLGLVSSLANPNGNATGVSFLTVELERKRLELVRELLPKAELIAFLLNPKNPQAKGQLPVIEAAARGFDLKLKIASSETEIESAYASLERQRVDQPQNRQVARVDLSPRAPGPRRRGDRVGTLAALHESGNGTFETCGRTPSMSVHRGRPEVIGRPAKRLFYPERTLGRSV